MKEVDVDTCTPLYEPSWDNVYSRTLEPSCGVPGGGCHSGEGMAGGLVFDDPDQAYTSLPVTPGDAQCSNVIGHLYGKTELMPPGSPLSDEERCAVAQWIAAGATR